MPSQDIFRELFERFGADYSTKITALVDIILPIRTAAEVANMVTDMVRRDKAVVVDTQAFVRCLVAKKKKLDQGDDVRVSTTPLSELTLIEQVRVAHSTNAKVPHLKDLCRMAHVRVAGRKQGGS
jgi:hypothetical protein